MKHRQPKREDWRMKPAKRRIDSGKRWFNVRLNGESIRLFNNRQEVKTSISTTKLIDGTHRHTIEYKYVPTIIYATDTESY